MLVHGWFLSKPWRKHHIPFIHYLFILYSQQYTSIYIDTSIHFFTFSAIYILSLLTDQEERTAAINQFRSRVKDVLVATDVASKGLDFPNIQHVINYDMPEDIENYGKEW